MEEAKSTSGSYAWRSILIRREVLKEGMRWRVGDGTIIHVWDDPWMPSNFLPFVPLINTASNRWDSAILRSIFLPRDVELIESIPLSSI